MMFRHMIFCQINSMNSEVAHKAATVTGMQQYDLAAS